MTPHVLLATTGQLPSSARLAIELRDAGARVSLIAPKVHPAWSLRLFVNRANYSALSAKQDLERAIIQFEPDMIIPCDERTVRDLHAIWGETRDRNVKAAIERSTAPSAHFPVITSRALLLAQAQQLGVRVPAFMPLPTIRDLDRWTSRNAAPFVLKADGSWSGFGVTVVSDASAAEDAYCRMSRPVSARLALRESLLEANNFDLLPWLRRDRRAISVQAYVDGWPANIGVACWQGEVLAATCAEAVETESPTGAATVLRIIHNQEMVDAAKRIVQALRLSGMIGFDFMIEAATGAAFLIEMNPRNTPICPVRLGPGRDLPEALVARLGSRPARERKPRTDRDIVVLFPDTWRENPSSHFLHTGYHDVPWEQPDLVRALVRPARRDRYRVFRTLRKVWLALRQLSPDSRVQSVGPPTT